MILAFVFVFGRGEKLAEVKEANLEKCTLPKQCFKDNIYSYLVCRGFKTLREIELKWENCSEYKEPISEIYFYPSEKIILDSSLNWIQLSNKSKKLQGFRYWVEKLKTFCKFEIIQLNWISINIQKYLYWRESVWFLSEWRGHWQKMWDYRFPKLDNPSFHRI